MKNKISIYTLLIGLTLVMNSCELLDTTTGENPAEKLSGKWQVSETSTIFKSALDAYSVTINIDEIDSNTIYISNFYGIGGAFDVVANIDGYSITLPTQSVDNNIFEGSGTISKNYKTINWQYTVEFESGEVDNVTAVYEKVE